MKRHRIVGMLLLLLAGVVAAQQPIPEEDSVFLTSSGTTCLTHADCDTGNPCRLPYCDPDLNVCRNGFVDPCCENDGVCYDGDPCTEDWSCRNGLCDYPPMPEGAGCYTDDRCMPFGNCQQGSCVGPQVECPFGAECQGQGRVRCLIEPAESDVINLTSLIGSYEPGATRTAFVDWGADWYHLNHLDFRLSGTFDLGLRDCDGVLTETRAQFTLETEPEILVPSNIYTVDGAPDEAVPVDRWMPYDTSRQGPVLGGGLLITFEYRARTDCAVLSAPLLTIEEFTLEFSGRRFFDANGNGLADLVDYESLATCLVGPDDPMQIECAIFDGNLDGRIDLADFHSFQNSLALR